MKVLTGIFRQHSYFSYIKAKARITREVLNLLRAEWGTERGRRELSNWVGELHSSLCPAPSGKPSRPCLPPSNLLHSLLGRMPQRLRQEPRSQSTRPMSPTPISIVMDADDVGRSPVYRASPISLKELLRWERSNEANPYVLLGLPNQAFGLCQGRNRAWRKRAKR
jgi:hypothetical protein